MQLDTFFMWYIPLSNKITIPLVVVSPDQNIPKSPISGECIIRFLRISAMVSDQKIIG